MANKHYGNFGDIWKHLALAEILHIESLSHYWESHSGSASYEFSLSPERDHGASYFFSHAEDSDLLKSSQFYKRFVDRFKQVEKPGIYPGSPMIALNILTGEIDKYLFCDTDADSIKSIEKNGLNHNIPPDKLKLEIADGLKTINAEAARIDFDRPSDVFALIDPYCIFDEDSDGIDPIQLFWNLISKGIKVMLWYSFNSSCSYNALWYGLRASAKIAKMEHVKKELMAAEVIIKSSWRQGKANPDLGIIGCGILCGNLSEKARSECLRLGHELCRLYKGSLLMNQNSGELFFRDIKF